MSQVDTRMGIRAASTARTALRIAAVLCTLEILFQGATAGQLLTRVPGSLYLHAVGAIVFHVLSGLMLIAAALLWRATRGSIWPTVISLLVFICGFVQAALGDAGQLQGHVPLSLVLLIGTVWVLFWSFLSAPGGRRRA
jgi:hypothetical protein